MKTKAILRTPMSLLLWTFSSAEIGPLIFVSKGISFFRSMLLSDCGKRLQKLGVSLRFVQLLFRKKNSVVSISFCWQRVCPGGRHTGRWHQGKHLNFRPHVRFVFPFRSKPLTSVTTASCAAAVGHCDSKSVGAPFPNTLNRL